MAQNGFIDNVEIWLDAINKRNLSSPSYNEDLAKEVFDFIKDFIPYANQLEKKISKEIKSFLAS